MNEDGSRAFDDVVVWWFHFTIAHNCESVRRRVRTHFPVEWAVDLSVLGDAGRRGRNARRSW